MTISIRQFQAKDVVDGYAPKTLLDDYAPKTLLDSYLTAADLASDGVY